MVEAQAAAKWLYERLTQDVDVASLVSSRVHESVPEQDAVYPLVVFADNSDQVTEAAGGVNRVMVRRFMLVKGICEGSSLAAPDAIARAIDRALTGAIDSVTVGTETFDIIGVSAMTPYRQVQVSRDSGKKYGHSGAIFRIDVSQTS